MFIDWASTLNLIDPDKNTGILKSYPYGMKKIMVQQTVSFLLEQPNGNSVQVINNKAHLSWIMEIVEQGFLLGIEDSNIISQCIELYKKWLFDPKHKPVPLQEDSDEFFQRKILEHLTLIFQPRSYPISSTIINVQVISGSTGGNTTQSSMSSSGSGNSSAPSGSQPASGPTISNPTNTNNVSALQSPTSIPSFKELIDTHTLLCQKVLQLYLDIGRALSKNFSTETFELWITLLLAITDCTLGITSITDETLAKNLCPLILKVLFEVWLHSKTRNATLWNSLCKYAFGWFHHMPMVNQWNITSLALTTPLLQTIYNTNNQVNASATVTIRLDDIQIEVDREYLYYSWHRMLNLIGNPNSIKNPNIFAAAIGGIFQLVSIFLSVTNDGNSVLHIFGSWLFEAVKTIKVGFDEGISLATEILSHIFLSCAPKIQFEPIYLSCFYSSLAEALWCEGKILLSTIIHTQNIFASELPGSRILIPCYLRALGKILTIIPGSQSEYLRKSAIKILGSIITLPNRYQGVSFPNFFPGRQMDPYPVLPGDIILSKQYEFNINYDIQTFEDVKQHLAHLILSALNTETSASNLQSLIWYIYIFQLEYQHAAGIPDGRSPTTCFIQAAINTILKKSSSFSNQWSPEVVHHSFQLLSELANQHHLIPNFTEIANNIVRKLCKFIIFKCREPAMSLDVEETLCLALQTISDWVVVSPWIFEGNYLSDTSSLYMTFNALTVALGGKNPNEESSSNISLSSSNNSVGSKGPSDVPSSPKVPNTGTASPHLSGKKYFNHSVPQRVRDMAQISLKTIINRLCLYPNPYHHSATDTSSKLTEAYFIQQIKERAKLGGDDKFQAEQCIRFFAVDSDFLVTLIDQPSFTANQTNYCTLIIRDMSGKSIINTNLTFLPYKPKDKDDKSAQDEVTSDGGGAQDEHLDIVDDASTNIAAIDASTNAINYKENQEDFKDLLTYIDKHLDENFNNLFNNQIKVESSLLDQLKSRLSQSISISPPVHIAKNAYLGDCKLQQARILLSQLGYINHYSQCKLLPLDNSIGFYQALQMLDTVSERNQTKVPIFYIKGGDQSEDDYLSNVTKDTTSDYTDFIKSLGWGVSLASHSGFTGGMDCKSLTHGKVAPYYSDHNKEVIFHVSTLIPNQQSKDKESPLAQEHKKKLLSKSTVAIVWFNGKIEQYEKNMVDTLQNPIQIVISPLSSGLFRVKTIKKTNSPNNIAKAKCGPVIDEVVVSKHILAQVVTSTATHHSYNLLNITTDSPTRLTSNQFANRKKLLFDIIESFKKEIPNFQFYNSLFEPMSPEQAYQSVDHLPPQQTFKFSKSQSVNMMKTRPQSVMIGSTPPVSMGLSSSPSKSSHRLSPTWIQNANGTSSPQLPGDRNTMQPTPSTQWGTKIEPTSKLQPTPDKKEVSTTSRITSFLTNRKLNITSSNEDNGSKD